MKPGSVSRRIAALRSHHRLTDQDKEGSSASECRTRTLVGGLVLVLVNPAVSDDKLRSQHIPGVCWQSMLRVTHHRRDTSHDPHRCGGQWSYDSQIQEWGYQNNLNIRDPHAAATRPSRLTGNRRSYAARRSEMNLQ